MMSAMIDRFGVTPGGEIVEKITLTSDVLSVSILTWGAVVQDVRLAGVAYPLTLGSDDLAAYAGPMKTFGAVMGPVANRIRNARAPIAGVLHRFEANLEGTHTKHGGSHGPHLQVWRIIETSPNHAVLELALPDGLSGFPGNRVIRAEYRVQDAALDLVLVARSDAPTLMNLANHSYWNLDGSLDAGGHRVQIFADRYTENGPDLIATGRVLPVEGTIYDFREPARLGASPARLYDLNYALAEARRPLTPAARITGEAGITMTLSTTEPGLQLFDFGSFDTAPFKGHHGTPYPRYSGIALEAQGWPDAANHPGWPSIEIGPDAPYHQHTQWAFSLG
jgi:aldose 1-epimerase